MNKACRTAAVSLKLPINDVASHAGPHNSATAGADSTTDSTTSKKTQPGLKCAGQHWHLTQAQRQVGALQQLRRLLVWASTPRADRDFHCTKGAHKRCAGDRCYKHAVCPQKALYHNKKTAKKQCPSSSTLRPGPRVCTKPWQQTRDLSHGTTPHGVARTRSGPVAQPGPYDYSGGRRRNVKHNMEATGRERPTTAPHTYTHKLWQPPSSHGCTPTSATAAQAAEMCCVRLLRETSAPAVPCTHVPHTPTHATKCCSTCPQGCMQQIEMMPMLLA